MQESVFYWLGHEFVQISCESTPGATAEAEMEALYERVDATLGLYGCSLADTVRSRMWAVDRDSRDAGSRVRRKILAGPARSASSSYFAPGRFQGPGRVGMDLLALRPGQGLTKEAVEYDPPEVPLKYCTTGPLVFLSGVTSQLPSLDEQMDDMVPRLSDTLTEAGTDWSRVAHIGLYHHRSLSPGDIARVVGEHVDAPRATAVYVPVDGYSRPDKLLEVEVTATRD